MLIFLFCHRDSLIHSTPSPTSEGGGQGTDEGEGDKGERGESEGDAEDEGIGSEEGGEGKIFFTDA